MGRVVNKSFNKVRKSIGKKSLKLASFITDYGQELWLPGGAPKSWTAKQSRAYDKLAGLCYDLAEEINNLDEIEVPDFEK